MCECIAAGERSIFKDHSLIFVIASYVYVFGARTKVFGGGILPKVLLGIIINTSPSLLLS